MAPRDQVSALRILISDFISELVGEHAASHLARLLVISRAVSRVLLTLIGYSEAKHRFRVDEIASDRFGLGLIGRWLRNSGADF